MYVNKLISGVSAGALFSQKPTLRFYPEVENCPQCGRKLNIQKTWEKTIVTMDIGAFEAKEVVFECPNDKIVFPSSQLRALAAVKCTYGFDVMVQVGMSLFVDCRNEQEIMRDLAFRNIFISAREIRISRQKIRYLSCIGP